MTICSGEVMPSSVHMTVPVLMSTRDTVLLDVLETHKVSPSQARNCGLGKPVWVVVRTTVLFVHHSPRAARGCPRLRDWSRVRVTNAAICSRGTLAPGL